jgi:uncharacterized membrane protein YciS (DUF1049 family)
MPWKLILFIVVFAIFLTFVTFNLDNRCDISFGFVQFEGVPVFLTVFISFSMGLICATPLVLHLRKKRKFEIPRKDRNRTDAPYPAAPADPETEEKIRQDAASAKEKFFARMRGGKK